MKCLAFASALVLASAAASSCVVNLGSDGESRTYVRTTKSERPNKSPSKVAYDNRKNLACLTAGMTVAEVLEVMGEETWNTSSSSRLTNPHRRDSFPMADGRQADVLYFYTDTRESDGLVGEDELSPVYFEDGKLVGWGTFGFTTWKERVLGL